MLVYATDRLARGDGGERAAHLVEHVLEGRKRGYRVESATEDLGGEMAVLMAALYGERAHADSRAKSQHTRAGKQRAAERGRRNGGPRPFGYRHAIVGHDPRSGRGISRLEIVQAEAEFVRRMYREAEAGRSQGDIARDLNRDGCRTTTGRRIGQPQIGAILRNRLYAGFVRYRNEWYPGQHVAIIPEDQWLRVQAARRTRAACAGRGGRPPVGSHLLTRGLLRCGLCGSPMVARTQRNKDGSIRQEWYRCEGRHSRRTECTVGHVPRAEIDIAVWDYLAAVAIDTDQLVKEAREAHDHRLADLRRQLEQARTEYASADERLQRIRADYYDGQLTAAEWREHDNELRPQAEAARAALAQLETRDREAESFALADAEADVLRALAKLRVDLASAVTATTDVRAARDAIGRVFERFEFYPCDVDEFGRWYVQPVPREDAVLVPLVTFEDVGGDEVTIHGVRLPALPLTLGNPNESPR